MQRWLTVLGGVLVVQIALALGLWLGSDDQAALAQGEPLAKFSKDAVEAVEITGGDDTQVRIERGKDGWTIPGADGFPAAKSDVEALLEALNGFDDRLPVARSEGARERFKVASGRFERRVRLVGSDGPIATVLLGKSAGPDRVYARSANGSMIYEVGFALRKAGASASDWYDDDVAGVSTKDVMQVRLPGFRVRRGQASGSWLVLPDGGEVQPAARGKAAGLVRRVGQPSLESVAKAQAPDASSDFGYTVTTRDGKAIRFDYYRSGEKGAIHLHRSDQPWRYSVSSDTFKKIKDQSAKDLLPAKSGKGSGKQGQGQASSSGGS